MEEGEVEKICLNCFYYRAKDYECENRQTYACKMFPTCSCSEFLAASDALTLEQVMRGISNEFQKITEKIKERIKEARSCLARVFSRKE